MATKLGLYNGALRVLRHARLETPTDDVEARRLLDDCYSGTVRRCLESGLWNFAQRSVSITPDEEISPSWGYNNAFEKPTDYVRLVAISDNEMMYPTLNAYLEETDAWHASVDPLYVSYVSDDATYGGFNLSRWPEKFAKAVEHELAMEVGPHLTSMGEQALARLGKDAKSAMRDARAFDAVNQPAQRPPPGRLVQARLGGSRLSQRRSNSGS